MSGSAIRSLSINPNGGSTLLSGATNGQESIREERSGADRHFVWRTKSREFSRGTGGPPPASWVTKPHAPPSIILGGRYRGAFLCARCSVHCGVITMCAEQAAPFDAAFLSAQREKLEAEGNRLESELARIAKKDRVGEDYHARWEQIGRSPDENVIEEQQYEASRSVEQDLELKLRDVHAALQRLVGGTYGSCATCGQAIDRRRLEALPSATTCVTHAERS